MTQTQRTYEKEFGKESNYYAIQLNWSKSPIGVKSAFIESMQAAVKCFVSDENKYALSSFSES